jgi:hypothetical protein
MVRAFLIAFVLSIFSASAWAQAQPALGTEATQTTTLATRSAAKKPVPKTKETAKPLGSVEDGACQIGVIPVVGDQFVVQKVGFTVFGNEDAEVPIGSWGLDDLVVTRVRAAVAPGVAVRRIAYAKEALTSPEQSKGLLFRDTKAELINLVRQIASGANCQRYVLVSRFIGQFSNTNQTVRGVGIVKWDHPLKKQTYLYALTYIRIFDGQDFSIIKLDQR